MAQRKVATAPINDAMLREADEVFITSTAGGVMPVTVVDDQPVGDGNIGPVTRKIMFEYWDAHSWPDWTTIVEYD
jgi:branched-chain amino acid aminotransferase